MLNKIAGLLGLFLISLTFIIGPLSRFFPRIFTPLRNYRKFLGISGFSLSVLHGLYSYLYILKKDVNFWVYYTPVHQIGYLSGALAIAIYLVMAITSNRKSLKILGSKRWKVIQTAGYLALLLNLFHFFFIETVRGFFIIRRFLGQAIFVFGIVVIITRLIVFFGDRPSKSHPDAPDFK